MTLEFLAGECERVRNILLTVTDRCRDPTLDAWKFTTDVSPKLAQRGFEFTGSSCSLFDDGTNDVLFERLDDVLPYLARDLT